MVEGRLNEVTIPAAEGKPALNMITCGIVETSKGQTIT
jgi:hypothetical protein